MWPSTIGTNAKTDWNALERTVRLAVRFQDDIIDYSNYPTPETKAQQAKERRVGIGTMGLGTMLIMLGLRYGSDEALDFINNLYCNIAYWAYDESMNLAAEKGVFPAFDYEKYVRSGFMKRLLAEFPELDEKLRKNGIRNVTLLTQAPTGTTGSYINGVLGGNGFPGVSTGIEPYYAFGYERTSRIGTTWIEEPIVANYRWRNDMQPYEELPDYFVTAQDLTVEDHVKTQAAIQLWVDSSISKTINAPADTTVEDVSKAYLDAYDLGVKGVTVYVDGSRQAQVLSTTKGGTKLERDIETESMKTDKMISEKIDEYFADLDEYNEQLEEAIKGEQVRIGDTKVVDGGTPMIVAWTPLMADTSLTKRPSRTFGFTERLNVTVNNATSKVYVTINVDEAGDPFEVFVNANDPSIADVANALGRLATQFLRYGGTDDNIAQAIKHLKRGQSNLFSLPSQIARLIEEIAYKGLDFPGQVRESRGTPRKMAKCDRCGEPAYDKVNCLCHSCGFSKCS